jgi:restriction system protein
MSEALQRSVRSMGTSASLASYAEELAALIGGRPGPQVTVDDATIEDPSVFAMERHLEDFLIANWAKTPFGKTHSIFEVDGVPVGQQYPTDTGPLDILAVSDDGEEILVLELKKGRASDAVVGQIQRYMGFVQEELANPGQRVRGAIIALDDDLRLRRALSVASNIDFFRYEVSFTLNHV